ncbi:MAG TPA: hypothetical protein VLR71_04200 [Casimicrobiaceae bacterium]|nr:hypothetical protein [Casimicrobiaceae bacterium]
MDKNTLSIVGQARALRGLCSELTQGAAREAFVARVDAEIARLTSGRVGVAIVVLGATGDGATASLLRDVAQAPLADACVLAVLAARGGQATSGGGVVHAALAPAAQALGIDRALVLCDARRVFGSPVLLGRVIEACDVVLVVGPGAGLDEQLAAGVRKLGESARCALRLDAPPDDPVAARLDGAFREYRAGSRASGETSWLPMLARELGGEARAAALAEAAAMRLGLCADLLNKHVQAEISLLRFRAADLARLRRGEDAQEPGGDPREQADMLKRTLQEWTDACKADLARSAEQGILPFDPRMLANRLTTHDLLHREEKAAAVIKYPVLGSAVLHPLVTHHFTVLPDPAAVERMRENLVTALRAQVHKDAAALNQRAHDLVARLQANLPLYPSFGAVLTGMRLPTLPLAPAEEAVAAVSLESEAEDKFVRVGFFKRLMEGRMVASMAFSFLTMSAGVFVLFGDPSIKRGLMKFSGVIVIMMVLYFIFSLLVKGEEEKQELDEVLERVRARLNQDVLRPLSKAQGAILKMYNEFVDDVTQSVLEAVEAVARTKSAERARVAEQRKGEDEAIKAFMARRQPAAMAAAQKTAAFATALERVRADLAKPAASAPAVGTAPGIAARPGVAASGNGAAAGESSLAERAAKARAEALARVAAVGATAGATPMSASARLAAARAQATTSGAPAASPREGLNGATSPAPGGVSPAARPARSSPAPTTAAVHAPATVATPAPTPHAAPATAFAPATAPASPAPSSPLPASADAKVVD